MGEFLSKPSAGHGSDKSGLNREAFVDRSRRFQGPPALRGKLTRWLLQMKAGVYVGTLSHRVRSRLWATTCESIRGGWAVLLYPAKTEQGFEILSCGKAPVVFEDFEGIWLVKTHSKP